MTKPLPKASDLLDATVPELRAWLHVNGYDLTSPEVAELVFKIGALRARRRGLERTSTPSNRQGIAA